MSIFVNLKDGSEVALKVNLFDGQNEIDIDKILRIDPNYILAETITFSSILNKIGILLADVENKVAEAKLDLEIWTAKEKNLIREEFLKNGEKITIDIVDGAFVSRPKYFAKKKRILRLEKEFQIMKSVYWAAKSKDDKLEQFALKLTETEIDFTEIIGKKFNGVEIQVKQPLIKMKN